MAILTPIRSAISLGVCPSATSRETSFGEIEEILGFLPPACFFFLSGRLFFNRDGFRIRSSAGILRRPKAMSFSYRSGYMNSAISKGVFPPNFSIGIEFTWLSTVLSASWSTKPSCRRSTSCGRIYLSSMWLFSRVPFWPDCIGSQ